MPTTERQLKKVMATTFAVDINQINQESSVDTIDNWDSLKHLNLIIALEAEFDITFTEEQTVEMLDYLLIKTVLKEHGIEFI